MGLDTKIYWPTDRESQSNFDFDPAHTLKIATQQTSVQFSIYLTGTMMCSWTR
jgi:hypothetical protein